MAKFSRREIALKRASIKLGAQDFTTLVEIRDHDFLIDEPEEVGGQDQGGTPSEILLASLASCTAITMKMYAKRKGWPLDGVDMEMELERQTESGELTTFIREKITLHGDLTEEQRKRILAIGKKCPVHRTLTSKVEISSEVMA